MIYRGYRIAIRKTSGFHANIHPPGARLAISDIPKSTREEGEEVLIERCKVVIDADILRVDAALAKRSGKTQD